MVCCILFRFKKRTIQAKTSLISVLLKKYHKQKDVTWNSVSVPLSIVHVSSVSIRLLMCVFCVIQLCEMTEKRKDGKAK